MTVRQCFSCGGFCKKSGCERANLPTYRIGPYKVDYADFSKALELACYYQNLCCDLEEILEMLCMDAEALKQEQDDNASIAALYGSVKAERDALREALEKLARLGNGDQYGNSDGNMIARAVLAAARTGT